MSELKKINSNYQNEIESLKNKIKEFKQINSGGKKDDDHLLFERLSDENMKV